MMSNTSDETCTKWRRRKQKTHASEANKTSIEMMKVNDLLFNSRTPGKEKEEI